MAQRWGFNPWWSQYVALLNTTLSALLQLAWNGTEVRAQSMVISICCIVEHNTVCIASVSMKWHRGEGSIHGGLNMLHCWTLHCLHCFSQHEMAQRWGLNPWWSQYVVLLNITLSALLQSTFNDTEARVQSMVVSICCTVEHYTVCIASVSMKWHRGEGSIHGDLNMLYCWT